MIAKNAKFAIKRDRISDQVARDLESMILSGELGLGETLPSERDLMARYGVGRPAIREALLWLNKKGMIAVSGGERAKVTEPDPAELLEHLSAAAQMFVSRPEGMQLFQRTRLFVEVALAREAATNATTEDVRRLEALLEANRGTSTDVEAFARTDDAFHFGIASLSRNPVISALYNSVLDVLQDQRNTSLQHDEALAAAIGCHERIFEGIAARDADAAEREMRRHLRDVETYYWAVRKVVPDKVPVSSPASGDEP